MKTSVALIIYKRPNTTHKVIKILQKIKPKKLYVIADGPKNKKEKILTDKTRKLINKQINWDCKITKIYSSKNLGLKNRMVSGLDKVFQKEEQAIILEDDCIPNVSFFKFCDQLLRKYKNNQKIFSISGTTHTEQIRINKSYYFSKYFHSWGWATWKRAWSKFDDNLNKWPGNKNIVFNNLNMVEKIYWGAIFNQVRKKKIDSYAYRWTYTHFTNQAYSIIPSKNLVTNIGFGKSSTHNKLWPGSAKKESEPLKFPLKHPKKIKINQKKDLETLKNIYITPRSVLGLIYNQISK